MNRGSQLHLVAQSLALKVSHDVFEEVNDIFEEQINSDQNT